MRIDIRQLAFPCVTRVRGEEASKKLQDYVGADQIEVDFNSVEMVSLSFLDGFISNLMRLGKERDIIFVIHPQIKEKLARVAGIRNATIYHCLERGAIQQVNPKLNESHESIFVPNKIALRR